MLSNKIATVGCYLWFKSNGQRTNVMLLNLTIQNGMLSITHG